MKHILLAALAISVPLTSLASPATDQASRLIASDFPAAIAILEQADGAGDRDASSQLAGALFFSPAPRMDRPRACVIAQRLAEADHGDGWALLASCQFTGTLTTSDRLSAARISARKAIQLGSTSGGTVLFSTFSVDPQYGYHRADGRVDPAKYASLAALPIDQRELQIEAWSGLSLALERRDALAALLGVAALADVSAPGNIDRLLAIADRSPGAARQFAAFVSVARRLNSLGGTHASVKSALDAHKTAMAAASLGSSVDGAAPCTSLALVKLEPGPAPLDLKFLPIPVGPLSNAYVISGRWQERWTYAGCGRELAVALAFSADGWGGTHFNAKLERPLAAAATAIDSPTGR